METFIQQIINGLVLAACMRWWHWLHDGLRHHQPDQLRARRGAEVGPS